MDDALGLNKIVEDKQSNQNWRLSNEGEPSRIDFADGLNRLQVIPQNIADFDLLAESMTAPPVAHIIFSRSEDKLITFQCFIQALLSEWKTLKPWCAACIILLAAVVEAFTSDTYIRSQAPRELSRHITEKIEKSSYKLEIIYEESRQGVSFAAFKLD
ncbi:unnamed protein product [Danaus chrysippus]|uniref:(African queen) hypothetical protein n=1 Tax=Danaus chrysippus TaxID=151541 RepID=A0A8J2W2T8_9NEOP|nr:unnamed protein product [Danaus chrysippus]